jgi:HD superfamily phosphohydrolase
MARKLGLDEDDARKVKLYGLLHDIGHNAFSHEGEDVLKRHLGDHEALGRKRMLEGEISDIISENYKPEEIADIGKSVHGKIIDSDLGSDRMDYLKRDALNTGVAYGIIDMDRIVHKLCLEDGELCIDEGGFEAAEYLLVARFMMFSTVYMHKTVRIATAMLYRAVRGSIDDGTLEPEDFLQLDDSTALSLMSRSKKGGRYAKALLDRRLYKEICSLPKESYSKGLEKELAQRHKADILVDYPHEFFKPVGLKVRTDDGLKPMTELSGLVQSLKRSEEERMKVLVLSEGKVKQKSGSRIAAGLQGHDV